ncbi:MAG: hypothetical protein LBT03_02810 [Holosporales bacterium]|jgi:hypothetical protein|nr:hypothetical protein [Holosporales bacterium]
MRFFKTSILVALFALEPSYSKENAHAEKLAQIAADLTKLTIKIAELKARHTELERDAAVDPYGLAIPPDQKEANADKLKRDVENVKGEVGATAIALDKLKTDGDAPPGEGAVVADETKVQAAGEPKAGGEGTVVTEETKAEAGKAADAQVAEEPKVNGEGTVVTDTQAAEEPKADETTADGKVDDESVKQPAS